MKSTYTVLLAGAVLAMLLSGCSGPAEKGGSLNNTSEHSWPERSDVANLSWYEYGMINGTTGMLSGS